MRIALTVLLIFSALAGSMGGPRTAQPAAVDDSLRLPEEKHLKNIRQLSFGGENAEAFSTELHITNH
jgi:hypothetical protein